MIHTKFANRIAGRYVDIYKATGFAAAQAYLRMIIKGDQELHEYLVPIIVAEGNRRK